MRRKAFIQSLAEMILGIPGHHLWRLAIDGVDAAVKTTLAEELARSLKSQSRRVIRASVDGFHQPKAIHCPGGSLSPEGFYRDSYHYESLIENLLAPLGRDGNQRYRTAVFDVQSDQPIEATIQTADADAILLMEGIFLLRPLLLPFWDLTIFLQADFDATVSRGIKRDSPILGGVEDAQKRYTERYVPGQKPTLTGAQPMGKADIVIDNNDPRHPMIIRKPPMELIGSRLTQN